MKQQSNPYLNAAIMEMINNQLESNTPPETRQTLSRLMSEGYCEEEAMDLIVRVAAVEIYHILHDPRPFDEVTFVADLNKLPTLPKGVE